MLPDFKTEKVNDKITRIICYTGEMAYLVAGSRKAALLDSGSGIGSIRACVNKLTDKPVTVLLTHGHVDHAFGAIEFGAPNVYMNHEDDYVYKDHSRLEKRKEGLAMCPFTDENDVSVLVPSAPCYFFHGLKAGDVFDFGDFTVEMYACPGHTKGMLVMLIPEMRTVLLGDACNYSTFLFEWYSTSVAEYEESLKKLDHDLEGKYDRVLISHGDGNGHPGIIKEVIEVCEDIRHHRDDAVPYSFHGTEGLFAKARDPKTKKRLDGGGGNVVYCKERIEKR